MTKSRTIEKLPVASRIARATSAEPPATARRNHGGSVPPAAPAPPRGEMLSAGSTAAAGFSSGAGNGFSSGRSGIEFLLDVRAGDDHACDHVDHQRDRE